MVAETSGLVGASLRKSPALAGAGEFFGFPEVRTRLTFTAERAFARSLILVAGVAQRAGGPVPAAASPPARRHQRRARDISTPPRFRSYPFKKGRIELKETVRTLFDGGGLLGLLHLLHDDRADRRCGRQRVHARSLLDCTARLRSASAA